MADSAETAPRITKRGLIAIALGHVLELYDFTIFASMSLYIGEAIFPGDTPAIKLLKTLLIFAVAFVVRPVGGILLGVYGDRAGRKALLTLTFSLMATGTLIIAATPGYAAIGIWSPLLLLFGRILQGISVGGETGGVITFVAEQAGSKGRGKYMSLPLAVTGIGGVTGTLASFLIVANLDHAQLVAYGWRLAFLFGLLIAPVAIFMRMNLPETREFEAEHRRAQGQAARAPFRSLITTHRWATLRGCCVTIPWAATTYALRIFMPVHAQTALGFDKDSTFAALLVGDCVTSAVCILVGWLSDRIGRQRMFIIAAAFTVITTIPMMWMIAVAPSILTLFVAQCVFCTSIGMMVGTVPVVLSETFPTAVRSSGTTFSHNFAYTLFGGFAMTALGWSSTLGYKIVPALYATVVTLLVLVFFLWDWRAQRAMSTAQA